MFWELGPTDTTGPKPASLPLSPETQSTACWLPSSSITGTRDGHTGEKTTCVHLHIQSAPYQTGSPPLSARPWKFKKRMTQSTFLSQNCSQISGLASLTSCTRAASWTRRATVWRTSTVLSSTDAWHLLRQVCLATRSASLTGVCVQCQVAPRAVGVGKANFLQHDDRGSMLSIM